MVVVVVWVVMGVVWVVVGLCRTCQATVEVGERLSPGARKFLGEWVGGVGGVGARSGG